MLLVVQQELAEQSVPPIAFLAVQRCDDLVFAERPASPGEHPTRHTPEKKA
jgi:hypothetical protein